MVCVQTLAKLRSCDKAGLFWEPVTPEIAADYADVIPFPMDMTTMASKIDGGQYDAIPQVLTYIPHDKAYAHFHMCPYPACARDHTQRTKVKVSYFSCHHIFAAIHDSSKMQDTWIWNVI
jgi:hypothetical protein